MKKTLLMVVLLSATLLACNNQTQSTEGETAASEEPESTPSPEIELTTFGYLPSVTGCSCYLAEDSTQYRNEQFVYAEKYGTPTGEDFAFIAINGEQVRLRIQDFQIDNEARTRKDVYANDNYEVTVDLQETKRADQEVMVNTGTLTLKTQEGKTVEQEVYGVCGC